jgi:hypothetical protein
MRNWLVHVASVATLVALPVASFAEPPTDQEKFRNKVDRFTNDSSFENPKRLCVCINDNNPDDVDRVGVLVDQLVVGSDNLRRIQVTCFVRRFNADGSNGASEACSSTWVPMR